MPRPVGEDEYSDFKNPVTLEREDGCKKEGPTSKLR
jgi:hypothetical protein